MQFPYTGLSGSSYRVPRLNTAPTRCPEDPDCPDPHMQSPYTGLSGSSCAVSLHRTIRILLSSPEAGHSPSEGSGLIRTVRILICSLPTQDCPDPPVQSPYTGLSGSSCRVPRLDTAPTHRPEDPDCPDDPDYPDPPVESRGWTQPLHTVRRIRTVRILLPSPEAGHSPYTQSGGSGLSGSSCRVPRLDTAPTRCRLSGSSCAVLRIAV